MDNNLIESRAVFSFHLDGNSEIDASLLSKTIADMAELAKMTSQAENPDAYLKMNVTAFRNGSFQIDFSAVCEAAKNFLDGSESAAELATKVISAIKGIFEIKKALKGEKPKNVLHNSEEIIVETQGGEKIIAPRASGAVINNIRVDQLVINISSYAQEHNPNGGFTIETEKGTVKCEPADIGSLVKPLPIEEITTCKRVRTEALLIIRKAVFFGPSRWGFDFNGRAIEANITDESFMKRFQENGTISKGDYIEATLEIYMDLDEKQQPIKGTEKYTVTNVHGDIQHGFDAALQESL